MKLRLHVPTQALQPSYFYRNKRSKAERIAVFFLSLFPLCAHTDTFIEDEKFFAVSCFLTSSNHGDVAGLNVVILAWVPEVVRGTAGAQICSQALQP